MEGLDDPAILEMVDMIGKVDDPRIVGHDDQRRMGPLDQVVEQRHDLDPILCIQIACRFIADDELRAMDHSSCDGNALLLASRELGGIGANFVLQS